jgi:hypothetical protein
MSATDMQEQRMAEVLRRPVAALWVQVYMSSGPRETRGAGSRGAGSRPSNAGRNLSAWFFPIVNHLPIVLCYVLYNFKSNKNDKKNANKGNTSLKKNQPFFKALIRKKSTVEF